MSKNQKTRILILLLTGLAVLGIMLFSLLPDKPVSSLSTPLSVLLRPFELVFNGVGNGISGFFGAMSQNAELRQENERLREENLDLRLKIKDNEQAAEAYSGLKEAFSLKDRFPGRRFVAANILQEPLEEGFDFYRLDLGKLDGLDFAKSAGYAVLNEQAALVGTVISADALSSKMLPFSHAGFSCSVYGERDLANSFELRGQGVFAKDQSLLADQIPAEANLTVGDRLYTSGKGGIFPEAVLCGKIVELSEADSLGLRTAKVEPAADPGDLPVLFVLLPTDENGLVQETGTEATE